MGMFDKDKVFAPDGPMDKWVDEGTEFILWDARVKDEAFEAQEGVIVTMCHWDVSPLESPENVATVSTIGSAMAQKAKDNDGSDLPAVVKTARVPSDKGNDAYVLTFVRAYEPKKSGAKA